MSWAWRDKARCKDAWPAVDMVEMRPGISPDALIEEYCDQCVVQLECLSYCLDDVEASPARTVMSGIWGGVFIPKDHRELRKRRIAQMRDKQAILRSRDAA